MFLRVRLSATTAFLICALLSESLSAGGHEPPISRFSGLPPLSFHCSELIVPKFYLSSERDVPKEIRRGYVYPFHIQRFQSLRTEFSFSSEAEAAFEFYLQIRLKESSPEVLREVRRLLSSMRLAVLEAKGPTAGFYMPKEGRNKPYILVQVDRERYDTGLFYSTLAHEIEHAVQAIDPSYRFNESSVPPERKNYWIDYLLETGAVRAEYEYMRLLSKEAKELCRQAYFRSVRRFDSNDRDLRLLDSVSRGFVTYRRNHIYSDYEAVKRIYEMAF